MRNANDAIQSGPTQLIRKTGKDGGAASPRINPPHLQITKTRVTEVYKTDHGYDARIISTFSARVGANGNTQINESEESRWIQMSRSGEINYDDLALEHPVKRAMDIAGQRASGIVHTDSFGHDVGFFTKVDELMSLGVPLFGLDSYPDEDDQLRALKKLKNWLEDVAGEWDATDPRIPPPEEAFDAWEITMDRCFNS